MKRLKYQGQLWELYGHEIHGLGEGGHHLCVRLVGDPTTRRLIRINCIESRKRYRYKPTRIGQKPDVSYPEIRKTLGLET